MPADTLSDAEAQVVAALGRRPAASRALVALAAQGALALPLAPILGPSAAAAIAGTAATCFLLGRQVERAAPLRRPGLRLRASWGAAREAGYPAIVTAGATVLAAILGGGA